MSENYFNECSLAVTSGKHVVIRNPGWLTDDQLCYLIKKTSTFNGTIEMSISRPSPGLVQTIRDYKNSAQVKIFV